MVAIRQTHSASFDFAKWVEALSLNQSQKEAIYKTNEFVLHCMRRSEVAEDFVDPDELVAHFNLVSSEIVGILMTLNMDLESIQVSVLYPAYESGFISIDKVKDEFGQRIADLLLAVKDMEAIKSLQNLNSTNVKEEQVDRVRRMLLAMVKDVRAVIIKLSERIAAIRAARNESDEIKYNIAKEIHNIYAPLANRLGIGQLKWELEDLAFKYLHTKEYMTIASKLGERRVEREQYVDNFVNEIKTLLKEQGFDAEVYGRPKHIYSIYKKMQKKHLAFEDLYDIRATRVVVQTIEQCYTALGIIHTRFEHLPKEFDDYIANPKPNGYQSIHTVVLGDGKKVVEVQIRTEQMHKFAELGVAAHWRYKEGSGQSQGVTERINWLRKLLSWRDDMVESGALLDEFKTKVFEDRVYVFTPKGEVIDLTTGSTPLDFAYAVHTMVGHRCIGAKVDGRIVPFTYKLKTGEQIEIITQKNPNPSRDWMTDESFLHSAKARNKVQAWFRKVDYDKNHDLGLEIIERELNKANLNLSRDQVVNILKERMNRFNVKTVDDLFAGVGVGDITSALVMTVLSSAVQTESETSIHEIINTKTTQELLKRSNSKSAIVVGGVDNMMSHLAKCCQPIPGDEILGFVTQGRGISVHRCNCEKLKRMSKLYPERLVDATWGENIASRGYTVTLRVVGNDYPGFLRDVTTVIANEKMNVLGVRSHIDESKDLSLIDIDLLVMNINTLERTISKLVAMPQTVSATRL